MAWRGFRILGSDEKTDWREMVIDAWIIAGLNFFTTLSGIEVTDIASNPGEAFLASAISAGLGFFMTLAVKRGLRRQ